MTHDFYISSSNHRDFHGCGDHCIYLRNGLTKAGFSAALTNQIVLRKNTISIFFEFFNIAQAEQLIELHKKRDLRFIIVATELITGNTFNNFEEESKADYGRAKDWKERFDAFSMLVPYAEAIWCLSTHQIDSYSAAFPLAQCDVIPLCFDPIEAISSAEIKPTKDISASFFGTVTKYREQVLETIETPVFYPGSWAPKPILIDCIKRSKISLHLNLTEKWPYTSNFRHHTLICNHGLCVSEKSVYPGELDEHIILFERADLNEGIKELLQRPDLGDLAEKQQKSYAANGCISTEMKALIDRLS